MFRSKPSISPLNAIAAAVAVAASLLIPPGVYFFVAYSTQVAEMKSQAQLDANAINNEIIGRAPLLWQFQEVRLNEMMSHRISEELLAKEFLRVRDNIGKVVAAVGKPQPWPTVTHALPLFDAGWQVGHLEIQRSLRPLLFNAAWLSLFGLVLAVGSFVTLRVIPLRAVLSANEILRQRDASLGFANAVFAAATEGSPDAILIVDQNGRIVTYNQHFIDLWQIPSAMVEARIDEPVLAAVVAHMRDTDAFLARVKYLYDHPEEASSERLDLKDGRIVDRHTRSLYGSGSKYLGRIWFFRDITERERAAEAVKQSEAQFRAIFDNARDGIMLTDVETKKFLIGNPRFCQMLGYTPEEFATLGMSDIHPAEALPSVIEEFGRHDRGETHIATDIPLQRKDGTIFYADVNSAPVVVDGRKYVLGLFRDVTERREAEEAVRRSEERYRNLVESTTDYIWEINAQNRYTYYSPAAIARLGYEEREFLGKMPFEIMAPEEAERIGKYFAPIAAARQPFSLMENTVLCKDGTEVVMETSGFPTYDTNGDYSGYRGIERDITQRKRAEQATQERLQRTQAQLQTVGLVGQAEALLSGDVESLAREITELATRACGCERANVWLFNEAMTELCCIDLYEATPAKHSEGMVLREQDFRHEIEVVKTSKYVNADEPLTDLRTKGYAEGYLKPLRITSMLDAVIQASNQTFGLLCLEHVDKPHHWEEDEIAFACQLADKIGLVIVSRMRRQAEAALQRRDALLHAVAVSATEFLTAPSLEEGMPRALEQVSQSLLVDRIVVLESGAKYPSAPTLRYIWEAPDIEVSINAGLFENPKLMSEEITEWQLAAIEGKIIITNLKTASGDVKKLLEQIGGKTLLIVPITVDGKNWGQISFETCKAERSWADFEIEILRTLAELIGNAIQRERYVREITNANRIVQNTPTILYRIRGEPSLPMIYISQNIKLFGHEPAALVTSPQLYQNLIHPDDVTRFRSSMAQVLETQGQRGTIEFRLLTSHGDYRWVENRYTPIRDTAGRLIEIEGLLIDVTERKIAEEKISLLARTDPLTGLANRTTFIERLQQTFAAARRGAASFAVLYLDIDRFKDVNDTLGHPLGDRLLTTVGERLTRGVRETDIVARFGGDEFAIMQTDLSDTADAGTLAAGLRAALAEPIQLGGNEVHITASVGIAIFAPDTAMPEDMLAQADVALYRAKEEGRDQYRFHTEELDLQVREQVAIAEELRLALNRDEFELFYQPQVELSTGQIVGMESLLRWNHPTRGLLMPGAFLAIAERTGAIAAIGQWVLNHACRQMSLWRKAGIAPVTIAVNISPAQIKAANEFVQYVCDTLTNWGLAPADLELDVTESMLARATFAQSDVLERLQKIGVKIAIDDFGTKFSTLDYLRTYRVNRLKIPQPLINAATRDRESAAMVRAIVGIARELNIEVIAQGVETEAQWTYLTATSPVTKVQGFFYSEPVPANRAEELLRRGRINPPESRRSKAMAPVRA
jgi:diguanylate cyclase (GGDEF)-like protein/PAS domain S-box-containing protein